MGPVETTLDSFRCLNRCAWDGGNFGTLPVILPDTLCDGNVHSPTLSPGVVERSLNEEPNILSEPVRVFQVFFTVDPEGSVKSREKFDLLVRLDDVKLRWSTS